MKIVLLRMTINTTYPKGYSSDHPRGLEGLIEVQTGPMSYETHEHKLSGDALRKIIDTAMADFTPPAQPEIDTPGVVIGCDDVSDVEIPAPETFPTVADDEVMF